MAFIGISVQWALRETLVNVSIKQHRRQFENLLPKQSIIYDNNYMNLWLAKNMCIIKYVIIIN